MKILKGIFDQIEEELHLGIADKAKVIKDEIIYGSGLSKDSVEESINKTSKSITDSIKEKKRQLADKASDLFKLPGFSKEDMEVDEKKVLESAEKALKEKEDDSMKVNSKKWQAKFSGGFDI
ncbi:MAG: hypothetical protein GDA37_07635 [Ekhidna sp.]|nr:hypothetical protein [Ekhidna sp.]